MIQAAVQNKKFLGDVVIIPFSSGTIHMLMARAGRFLIG